MGLLLASSLYYSLFWPSVSNGVLSFAFQGLESDLDYTKKGKGLWFGLGSLATSNFRRNLRRASFWSPHHDAYRPASCQFIETAFLAFFDPIHRGLQVSSIESIIHAEGRAGKINRHWSRGLAAATGVFFSWGGGRRASFDDIPMRTLIFRLAFHSTYLSKGKREWGNRWALQVAKQGLNACERKEKGMAYRVHSTSRRAMKLMCPVRACDCPHCAWS